MTGWTIVNTKNLGVLLSEMRFLRVMAIVSLKAPTIGDSVTEHVRRKAVAFTSVMRHLPRASQGRPQARRP